MSRVVDILKSIQNKETYNKDALSRAEEILKAICNNTSITMTARSRYETLLLCLKNKTKTTLTPRTRLEEILVAIINGTINTWITGKNLFDESKWKDRTIIDGKQCLVFSGFFKIVTGEKTGNPIVFAENLAKGTYTISGRFKKTVHFNALCGMDEENGREVLAEFADNFEQDAKTFTTTKKYKYLYIETGKESAKGYCEIDSLKLEIGSTATPYSPYCFLSELEEEYYKTFGVWYEEI